MGACLFHGDKLCLSCLPVPETQLKAYSMFGTQSEDLLC